MDTELRHPDDPRFDAGAAARFDRRRLSRAFNASLAFVLLLVLAYSAQSTFDVEKLAVQPHSLQGLRGVLFAPLVHGSVAHIAANATALLILGTLAGSVYPRATLRALPLLWLGSGLGAWLLGEPGSVHLGASGVANGLMFLVFTLGVLRRDRASIAAGFIAILFYGGALLAVLPHEAGISWQSHLGGALGGIAAAILWRERDPRPPRKKYSWEIEEELEAQPHALDAQAFEPPAPPDTPVSWPRPQDGAPGDGGVPLFPPDRAPRKRD